MIAVNHYHQKFHNQEFAWMGLRALQYLHSEMSSVEIDGIQTQAVRFNSQKGETSWDQRQVLSFEHNLDFKVALHGFQGAREPWMSRAEFELQEFLSQLWSGDHYWPGYNLQTLTPNREEIYLDTQAWASLGTLARDSENRFPRWNSVRDRKSKRTER